MVTCGAFSYKSEVGISKSVFQTANLKAFQGICTGKKIGCSLQTAVQMASLRTSQATYSS